MEGRGQSARVVLLSRGLRACGVHGAEHEATSWMPSPSALRAFSIHLFMRVEESNMLLT